jgi:hypothetical protein
MPTRIPPAEPAHPGWWLPGPYLPAATVAARRPDFLVVSPPKTGSTWLAENLRAHPGVFVPAVKELKYFSSLFKWVDPAWYLEQFAAGEGRVKGEASPSYALLPVARIRLLRHLAPGLKVVFLLRDPVARAWSHAKHTHRHREATFADHAPDFAAVTESEWVENLAHDWVAASGDYLGQLRRWLSVFPRDQVFVGFHEDIAIRPAELLREVLAFLGVDASLDLAAFPLHERILAGQSGDPPPGVRDFLHRQWHGRTRELVAFLKRAFDCSPPQNWADTPTPRAISAPVRVSAFAHERDDAYLARVVANEERFPAAFAGVLANYFGYDIVFARGRLVAASRHLGPADLPNGVVGADADTLRRLEEAGHCHFAPTLGELKERVARHVAERTEAHARALGAELGAVAAAADARIDDLERQLAAAVERIQVLEGEAVRMTHRELVLLERVRRGIQGAVRAARWANPLRPMRRFPTARTPQPAEAPAAT